MGLMSYEEAAVQANISERRLRDFASKKFCFKNRIPVERRLRVVHLGHRSVGIRPNDLNLWLERNAS